MSAVDEISSAQSHFTKIAGSTEMRFVKGKRDKVNVRKEEIAYPHQNKNEVSTLKEKEGTKMVNLWWKGNLLL